MFYCLLLGPERTCQESRKKRRSGDYTAGPVISTRSTNSWPQDHDCPCHTSSSSAGQYCCAKCLKLLEEFICSLQRSPYFHDMYLLSFFHFSPVCACGAHSNTCVRFVSFCLGRVARAHVRRIVEIKDHPSSPFYLIP